MNGASITINESKTKLISTETWILIATILGSSMAFIDSTAMNVVLPVFQLELNAKISQVQWVIEAYALMLASLLLLGGALGDHFGIKKIFMIGVVIFSLSSLWCGLSPDINQLIIARAFQGVGSALLVPGSLAIITSCFKQEKKRKSNRHMGGINSAYDSSGTTPRRMAFRIFLLEMGFLYKHTNIDNGFVYAFKTCS